MTLFNYVLLATTNFWNLLIGISLENRFATSEVYDRMGRTLQPRNFVLFGLTLNRS